MKKIILIIIGVSLITKLYKKNSWETYKKYYFLKKRKIMSIKEDENKFINNIMKWVVFLAPVNTVCIHRSIVAFHLYKIIGHNKKIAFGYNYLPFTLHIWIEDSGNICYNSPSTVVAKKLNYNLLEI